MEGDNYVQGDQIPMVLLVCNAACIYKYIVLVKYYFLSGILCTR